MTKEEMFGKEIETSEDAEVYRLSQGFIMQMVLNDFGIDVSLRMSNAIFNSLMFELQRQGYIGKVEEDYNND